MFAVCSRRLRLISPIRRNVVGRLCGRPTIVFLIFQIKKHGLGLSFCDKHLIQYFSRCDVLASTPHSKNTPYNRFSSNYHRKLYFIICTILRAHLRNQKLSMRRMSSKYPRKLYLYICGPFRDKRLI